MTLTLKKKLALLCILITHFHYLPMLIFVYADYRSVSSKMRQLARKVRKQWKPYAFVRVEKYAMSPWKSTCFTANEAENVKGLRRIDINLVASVSVFSPCFLSVQHILFKHYNLHGCVACIVPVSFELMLPPGLCLFTESVAMVLHLSNSFFYPF